MMTLVVAFLLAAECGAVEEEMVDPPALAPGGRRAAPAGGGARATITVRTAAMAATNRRKREVRIRALTPRERSRLDLPATNGAFRPQTIVDIALFGRLL